MRLMTGTMPSMVQGPIAATIGGRIDAAMQPSPDSHTLIQAREAAGPAGQRAKNAHQNQSEKW
jgi:hypothetical protein